MPFDPNSVPGFLGWSAQSKRILAETEGFFGWSAGLQSNLLFNIIGPNGSPISDLTITVTYPGQGSAEVITYNESIALERLYPVDVLITVVASGPTYDTNTSTITLSNGQVKRLDIQLTAKPGVGYVRYTRRRYLTS